MNNNEVICNYLVRDNEIEELKKRGYDSSYHIATYDEYIKLAYEHIKDYLNHLIFKRDEYVVYEIFDLLEQCALITDEREKITAIKNYVLEIVKLYKMDLNKIYEIKLSLNNKKGDYHKKIVLEKYWKNLEIDPQFIEYIEEDPFKYFKKVREAAGLSTKDMIELVTKHFPDTELTEETLNYIENPINFNNLDDYYRLVIELMIVIIDEDIFKEVIQLIEEIQKMVPTRNSSSHNEVFYYYKESLEDLARKNSKCNVSE